MEAHFHTSDLLDKDIEDQEGGGVSRVNIGSLITASVMSRHTSVIFKMAGKFLVRYVAKDVNFPNFWIHLLPSSIRRSF